MCVCTSCLCCDVGNKFIFITQDADEAKDVGGAEGASATSRRHAYKVLYVCVSQNGGNVVPPAPVAALVAAFHQQPPSSWEVF